MIKNQFEWYSQRTRWTRDDFSGNDSRGLWPFFLFIIGCLSFKSEKIVQWIVGNDCYYVCGTIGEHWTRKQDGCPILGEIDGELRNKSKVKWVYSLNRGCWKGNGVNFGRYYACNQSSREVSRLFCVAWSALAVPGSGKLGPSTRNLGLRINSSGRGVRHYKSYSFGLVHLESATTRWKKENYQRSLWRQKEGRKKRDRNVTIQITRENCYVFLCARLRSKGCFLTFWVLIEISCVAKYQPVWLVMSQ